MAMSPDGEMGSPLISDIAGITEAVRTLADQELRPLDLQVIYMLKTCLHQKEDMPQRNEMQKGTFAPANIRRTF